MTNNNKDIKGSINRAILFWYDPVFVFQEGIRKLTEYSTAKCAIDIIYR